VDAEDRRRVMEKLDSSDNTLYRIEELLRESLANQKWQINDLREQIKSMHTQLSWISGMAVVGVITYLVKSYG
jgi:hypothetical protein